MLNARLLEVADEAIRAGIEVRVRILNFENPALATGTVEALKRGGYAEGTHFLEVEGFYKNGAVVLIHNDKMNYTEVFGRYDLLDSIGDGWNIQGAGQRLAEINFSEYRRYNERGFSLDKRWIPLLVQHGIIRPVTKIETTYEVV